jgi:hypothetical protein
MCSKCCIFLDVHICWLFVLFSSHHLLVRICVLCLVLRGRTQRFPCYCVFLVLRSLHLIWNVGLFGLHSKVDNLCSWDYKRLSCWICLFLWFFVFFMVFDIRKAISVLVSLNNVVIYLASFPDCVKCGPSSNCYSWMWCSVCWVRLCIDLFLLLYLFIFFGMLILWQLLSYAFSWIICSSVVLSLADNEYVVSRLDMLLNAAVLCSVGWLCIAVLIGEGFRYMLYS